MNAFLYLHLYISSQYRKNYALTKLSFKIFVNKSIQGNDDTNWLIHWQNGSDLAIDYLVNKLEMIIHSSTNA